MSIAAAAVLFGMRGYKAITGWAAALSPIARARFRYRNGRYYVPSMNTLRDVLMRVAPQDPDQALQRCNEVYGAQDKSLAIDGKTMCNAMDDDRQTHVISVAGQKQAVLHPKKVATLPVEGSEEKRTNEIKTAIPPLDAIDIADKTITADALLTQRELAEYLLEERSAHYHFTVKGNQKNLLQDIALHFDCCAQEPDFTSVDPADHGRVETRNIWVTSDLNEYLDFPHAGQAVRIEPTTERKKSAKQTCEVVYGVTGKTENQAKPAEVLQDNRGHWTIANNCHHIIDWNYDEDRSRICNGNGPSNISRLRRFAVGIIKSKKLRSVA